MALTPATRLRLLLWTVAVAAAAAPTHGPAGAQTLSQTPAAPEYQLKAVFLFNFAQFVEWPVGAFADSAAPLVVGVLGEDPFGPYLDEIIRGEVMHGHPLAVRRYQRLEDLGDCHILFVNRSELGRLEEIFDSLKGRSVLTVGDAETFTSRGGMIRFVTDRSRIRLRINLDAARRAGLKLSSKLLRPATIVAGGKD